MRLSTPHGHDFFHEHGFFLGHDFHDASESHRSWLIAVGALYAVMGVAGLFWLALSTLVSVLFFGALALVGGVVQLVQSFSGHGRHTLTAGTLLGVLYLVTGTLILTNPLASSLVLTLFLAGALCALGVVRVVFALEHKRDQYWTWSLLSGALSIVIAFLIIMQWPVTGLWMIGLFVSVEMLCHGTAAIALAMGKKSFL
jgi:uncharacterized membrane protein HdeD (DUF308 family)